MAFISNCPKCQKSVLVPEGHGHDAVVQCPACFVEYPLGEILSAVPALIVVRPSSAAVGSNGDSGIFSEARIEPIAVGAPAAGEGGIFAHGAHTALLDPAQHDNDALDFVSEGVPLASDEGHSPAFATDAEQAAADALFLAAVGADAPAHQPGVEQADEPMMLSADDVGHEAEAEGGSQGDDWGGNWGGFGDDAAHMAGDDVAVEVAEHEGGAEGEMAHVDFASITGTAAPATAAEGGVAVEPPKKKKRKRETNPLVRLLGMAVAGLLAVACVFAFMSWRGMPLDFLPSWLQFGKPASQSAGSKPATPPGTPNKTEPATNPNPSGTETGKTGNEAGGNGAQPAANTAGSSAGTLAAGKNEIASNGKPGKKSSALETDDSPEPGDGFGTGADDTQPPIAQPGKNDLGAPAVVAPVNDKPKTETPGKSQSPVTPATPVTPAPSKPAEADPFSSGPATPSAAEKPKAETPSKSQTPSEQATPSKPDATDPLANPPAAAGNGKPNTEPVLETPTPAKPEATKPESPAKPDADPFTNPPVTAPVKEQPETEPKPETPTPAKPPISSPEIELPKIEPKPKMPAPTKPDSGGPAIPVPTKPETVKPEPTPETKASAAVAPLGAPSIPAAQLDAALAHGGGAAPKYSDLCQLAEAATYANGVSAVQKQSLQTAVKKLAGDPREVARLAAEAKKLLEGNASKGGIVLSGKVSGVGSKNGLFGTAIRMEGMSKPVMIFSSHPLDVRVTDSVLILGALVNEPAKNLPGYTGKLPVVVWAQIALRTGASAVP